MRPTTVCPRDRRRPGLFPVVSRPSCREKAARPTRPPAPCRLSPAPYPNRDRSRALPGECVPLDLLVEIRPRHLQRTRCLAHVPIMLAELGEKEGALGGVLELLEGLGLEQRSHS